MSTESNLGKWAPWYQEGQDPVPYGDPQTYLLAAEHLVGLAVEDWGCGYGWFKRFHDGEYLGVDGTESPWCDVVDDLTQRISETPGLMMRHVLEHNVDWPAILDNAVLSAQDRLVIVTFVPNGSGETVGFTEIIGVPDIAVPHAAISEALTEGGWEFTKRTLATQTQYGTESIWLAVKAPVR